VRAYYAPAQHQKNLRYPHVPATLPLTDSRSVVKSSRGTDFRSRVETAVALLAKIP
jgi:hypothetical protein